MSIHIWLKLMSGRWTSGRPNTRRKAKAEAEKKTSSTLALMAEGILKGSNTRDRFFARKASKAERVSKGNGAVDLEASMLLFKKFEDQSLVGDDSKGGKYYK